MQPIFYHCPHGKHRKKQWPLFIKKAQEEIKKAKEIKIKNVSFFTYNNKNNKCLFEQSIIAHKLNCIVLAKKCKHWNWLSKITPLIAALEKCKTDYIISADGFDVFISNPTELIEKFLTFKCNILFCSTPMNMPKNNDFFKFEKEIYKSIKGHLNAGVYIGKKDFVLKVLKEIYDRRNKPYARHQGKFHDQAAWRYMHKQYYPAIKIDHEEKIITRIC